MSDIFDALGNKKSDLNLDLTDIEDSSGVIPPGTCYVTLSSAELKETKSGTGEYINCKFNVLSGPHRGRVIFHMFNIKNQSVEAVKIGLTQLKQFMKCAGLTEFKLTDPVELIGLKCDVVVKIQHSDYGTKNVISYFKPHKDEPEKENDVPF